MKPLYDGLFVKPTAQEIKSGGIYIPPSAKAKISRGVVIAIGDGRPKDDGGLIPLILKVGDTVWYPTAMAQPLDIDNLLLIHEGSILAFERK